MLLRVFAAGCIAIAVQMTLGTLLLGLVPSPDWVVFGIAAIFIFGVPLGIAVTRPLPALTFPTMGLLATCV